MVTSYNIQLLSNSKIETRTVKANHLSNYELDHSSCTYFVTDTYKCVVVKYNNAYFVK